MMQVSVLLPVRNGAHHLDAAFQSLLRQTRPPDEIVVVDDASGDGTPSIISAWQRRLPLRRLLGRGKGLVDALNRGLEVCQGVWVARMDGDDIMHPHRIQEQLHYLDQNPTIGVCGTEVLSFPPSRVSEKRAAYDAWLSGLHTPEEHARDMFVEAPLAHPSAMIARSDLERVNGYHDCGWPEDYDLWLRLHGAGVAFGKPRGVLHFWREGVQRLSRTSGSYSPQAIRACRLHHAVEQLGLRDRPVVVMGAGTEGKAAARVFIEQGVQVLAHVDADPRKVGGRLMGEGGVRVHAPHQLAGLLGTTPRPLVAVAIGTAGSRPTIRHELESLGLVEGRDAVFFA